MLPFTVIPKGGFSVSLSYGTLEVEIHKLMAIPSLTAHQIFTLQLTLGLIQ